MKYVEQNFKLTIELDKQCAEPMTCDEVTHWFEEFMEGCDVGELKIVEVTQQKKEKFCIIVTLKTECDTEMDPSEVTEWLEEYAEGCDVGELFVTDIELLKGV